MVTATRRSTIKRSGSGHARGHTNLATRNNGTSSRSTTNKVGNRTTNVSAKGVVRQTLTNNGFRQTEAWNPNSNKPKKVKMDTRPESKKSSAAANGISKLFSSAPKKQKQIKQSVTTKRPTAAIYAPTTTNFISHEHVQKPHVQKPHVSKPQPVGNLVKTTLGASILTSLIFPFAIAYGIGLMYVYLIQFIAVMVANFKFESHDSAFDLSIKIIVVPLITSVAFLILKFILYLL